MQDLLSTAIEMHRTGDLAPAGRLYEQVLEQEQDNSDALHLLGVVHHQRGDHARAVELMSRAVALRPNATAFHADLAEAYRASGQLERAVGCCRTALRLWPGSADARCNLGLALQAQGRKVEAIEQFRLGIAARPDFAPLHNNLGIVLRELGQLDEACAAFRRAVELDPLYAPAQSNLGQLLLERGQAEEALPHAEAAIRLQPDTAAMHHNLGNVLRTLNRRVDARAAYLEALRLAPNMAVTHAHLGLALHCEGQFGSALPWLKQAVELEPNNADFCEYLAELYGDMDDHARAIPYWERALAQAADRIPSRVSLGWALQEEGRLDEAGAQYRVALQLQPNAAIGHLNLGGLHEELGDLTEAEAAFRAALRLQPDLPMPHARLATLLRGKLPGADLEALEKRLTDPNLVRGPRGRLLFALAHVLDARGEYAKAAECAREANALILELNRGRREYSPEEHARFVDQMVQVFNSEYFARRAGAGLETCRPVFVFGLPRSGTTLVEQVLASHPRIFGAGELRLARQTFDAIPALLDRAGPPLACLPEFEGATIGRAAAEHLEHLAQLDDGRNDRIVNKMPDNYMYLGLLAVLFPRATFIHCRRDLRDVAVSCWMTDFRSIRWANDFEHLISRFTQYGRLMDHWRSALPVRIHEVQYDSLVSDLELEARRLLTRCGMDWDAACLDFHRTRRPIRTASVTQVRKPLYRQSVARWKNYENELGGLFQHLNSD